VAASGPPFATQLASPGAGGGAARLMKVGNFDEPVYVASPPGDSRVFVVERPGRIKVLGANGGSKTYLDIAGQVSSDGERGLFSVAFAPDYSSSGLAYVDYTDTNGDSRIVEFKADQRDRDRLDPGSRRELLFVKQPYANHNGGQLQFDPSGMLLIGFGDGGSGGDPENRAQNLGQLLGKILRIDPRRPGSGKPYGIPGDNPFISRSGARPEIWAYGLRNPWRFSFDPETKDLFVGDVGQDRFEEIDYVAPGAQSGANYGWRRYEGNLVFKEQQIDESRLVRPIVTYPLTGGHCAVTAGGVYRGQVESMRGYFLYTDFCKGPVKGFKVKMSKAEGETEFPPFNAATSIASFGEDAHGDKYLASLSGAVYKITR